MRALLNVGGGNKQYPVSAHFAGWKHDLLDIDPAGHPDLIMDARQLVTLPPASYDAVYCAHNLEHYHRHDAARVVRGFHHVLKPEGFAEIHVPDLQAVIQRMVRDNLDIDDTLYTASVGPLLARDLIYGYHVQIERSGQDYYAHKTGFTPKSLARFMVENGFPLYGLRVRSAFEIGGYFFKQTPTPEVIQLLSLQMP